MTQTTLIATVHLQLGKEKDLEGREGKFQIWLKDAAVAEQL